YMDYGKVQRIPEAMPWTQTSKYGSRGRGHFKRGGRKNRSKAWHIRILILVFGAHSTAAGRQQQASALSQVAGDAAAAYDGKDWAKAAKLYAQIVQTAPNPRAWYRLGVSLNKVGENDKA